MPAASRSIPYRPRSEDLTKVSIKPTLLAERCGQTLAEEEIVRIRARLASLDAERAELEASLAEIERRTAGAQAINACSIVAANISTVTTASPTADKVALFRRLFAGRSDVFPLRWENAKTGKAGYAPACANEWIRGVCGKPQVKCGECPHQAFIPVSDEIIDKHLRGGDGPRAFVAGVYPMLPDETCWFLAADFDKESWAADAAAMVETCKAKGVPAALERSRSGAGAHVWIFFSEPVPARAARQLGAAIMTETMERRPEIGFASYDRFFPSQDTMPVGGFGNLIALPCSVGRANTKTASSSMKPFDPTRINGRSSRRLRVCPPTRSRTWLPTRRRGAGYWTCACRWRMRTPTSHGA